MLVLGIATAQGERVGMDVQSGLGQADQAKLTQFTPESQAPMSQSTETSTPSEGETVAVTKCDVVTPENTDVAKPPKKKKSGPTFKIK